MWPLLPPAAPLLPGTCSSAALSAGACQEPLCAQPRYGRWLREFPNDRGFSTLSFQKKKTQKNISLCGKEKK